MAGTEAGGKQAAVSNKKRHGPDFYKRIGTKGGNTPKTKPSGFAAMPRRKVAAWGRKGGKTSTRLGIKGGEGTSHSAQYRKRKRELTAYELYTQGDTEA